MRSTKSNLTAAKDEGKDEEEAFNWICLVNKFPFCVNCWKMSLRLQLLWTVVWNPFQRIFIWSVVGVTIVSLSLALDTNSVNSLNVFFVYSSSMEDENDEGKEEKGDERGEADD